MITRTLALAGILTLCSCSSRPGVPGSGNILVEERSVAAFQAVDVSGGAHVILTQGSGEILSIECDDNLLPHLITTVEDGVLRARFESGRWNPSQPIVYRVGVEEIRSVSLSGSVEFEAGPLSAESLEVLMSGSGELSVSDGVCEKLGIDIRGRTSSMPTSAARPR